MPDLAMASHLDHVEMADQVRLAIGCRILDRIANSGLRPQVDDLIELPLVQSLGQCELIGEIDFDEIEVLMTSLQFGDLAAQLLAHINGRLAAFEAALQQSIARGLTASSDDAPCADVSGGKCNLLASLATARQHLRSRPLMHLQLHTGDVELF